MEHIIVFYFAIRKLVHCVLNLIHVPLQLSCDKSSLSQTTLYPHVVKQIKSGLNWFGYKARQDHVILTLLGQCRTVIERQKLTDCLLLIISLLTI